MAIFGSKQKNIWRLVIPFGIKVRCWASLYAWITFEFKYVSFYFTSLNWGPALQWLEILFCVICISNCFWMVFGGFRAYKRHASFWWCYQCHRGHTIMSKRLVNAFSLLLEARVGPIFSTSCGIAKFSFWNFLPVITAMLLKKLQF